MPGTALSLVLSVIASLIGQATANHAQPDQYVEDSPPAGNGQVEDADGDHHVEDSPPAGNGQAEDADGGSRIEPDSADVLLAASVRDTGPTVEYPLEAGEDPIGVIQSMHPDASTDQLKRMVDRVFETSQAAGRDVGYHNAYRPPAGTVLVIPADIVPDSLNPLSVSPDKSAGNSGVPEARSEQSEDPPDGSNPVLPNDPQPPSSVSPDQTGPREQSPPDKSERNNGEPEAYSEQSEDLPDKPERNNGAPEARSEQPKDLLAKAQAEVDRLTREFQVVRDAASQPVAPRPVPMQSPFPGHPIHFERIGNQGDFGSRANPVTGKQGFHNGVDLGASVLGLTGYIPGRTELPVHAIGPGTVAAVGSDKLSGNYLVIEHPGGVRTGYAHLRHPSPLKQGQAVDSATVIGIMGGTGQAAGDHLHLTLKVNGMPVDPVPWLKGEKTLQIPPAARPDHQREIGRLEAELQAATRQRDKLNVQVNQPPPAQPPVEPVPSPPPQSAERAFADRLDKMRQAAKLDEAHFLPVFPGDAFVGQAGHWHSTRGPHRLHKGLDFYGPARPPHTDTQENGSRPLYPLPVFAPVSGSIVSVAANDGGAGNWVQLKGDDGHYYNFIHLAGFDRAVGYASEEIPQAYHRLLNFDGRTGLKKGDRVNAGQEIGFVGMTGTGWYHLHFEEKTSEAATQINPFDVAQGASPELARGILGKVHIRPSREPSVQAEVTVEKAAQALGVALLPKSADAGALLSNNEPPPPERPRRERPPEQPFPGPPQPPKGKPSRPFEQRLVVTIGDPLPPGLVSPNQPGPSPTADPLPPGTRGVHPAVPPREKPDVERHQPDLPDSGPPGSIQPGDPLPPGPVTADQSGPPVLFSPSETRPADRPPPNVVPPKPPASPPPRAHGPAPTSITGSVFNQNTKDWEVYFQKIGVVGEGTIKHGGRAYPKPFRNVEEVRAFLGAADEVVAELNRVAGKPFATRDVLLTLMRLETAGTFSPQVSNGNSRNGGRGCLGLIQFCNTRAVGLSPEQLTGLSPVEQLKGPVRQYFIQFIQKFGPPNGPEDLYSYVLYPAHMVGKPPDAVVMRKYDPKTGSAYRANRGLDRGGDGQILKKDIIGVLDGILNSVPDLPVPGNAPDPRP